MTKLVAFGHRKDVGKDECAKFLKSHLRITRPSSNIRTVGFADKLKDVCHQLYGWAGLFDKEYYERNRKDKDKILSLIGKSPRQIWIEFGTLVGREVYTATWVDYLFHNITANVIIITDMRFPNEAERIKYHNGFVIKVNRPGKEHIPDIADDPLEGYTGWTHIIENDGTLGDLNKKMIDLSEQL